MITILEVYGYGAVITAVVIFACFVASFRIEDKDNGSLFALPFVLVLACVVWPLLLFVFLPVYGCCSAIPPKREQLPRPPDGVPTRLRRH